MAQKIQALFIDDLDGSEAEGTTRFSLDGSDFEIDLNAAHIKELQAALSPYIAYARKAPANSAHKTPRKPSSAGKTDAVAIRTWARAQGISIQERGRVPADIVAKYQQATTKPAI